MKNTKRILSIVLSVLIAVASMPMMYTAATAAGTIDNPTTALEESNPFEHEDLYKLNIERSNNDFFFYQTIDDEYFVVKQNMSVQQYTVSLGSNRTLTFQSLGLYEGGSNAAESTGDAGVYEHPVIDANATSEFKSNYYVSDSWASTNDNASGLDCTNGVNLEASGWDLNGSHKTYAWEHSTVFKGHSADVTGTINTSFYERMAWNWVSDDSSASMDFRIKTSITVVDAREFVKALAEAENVVSNPSAYPEGYVSAIQAVLNSIPASAKNLSVRYDQSELDSFANQIRSVKTNSANYTQYNYTYNYFSSMTNDEGIYSGQSFSEFKAEIERINKALSKDLTMEDQAIVDQAVEDLKTAYKTILLTNATLTPDVTHTETIEGMTVTVGTEFNLIQVKDNQKFSLAQPWTISHDKSQARKFAVTLDVSDTNTNTFISHLDSTSYGTQDFDNKALSQTGATVFTCWDELDANGAFKDSSDFLNEDTRTINASYDGFKKGNTYYLQSTPIFYGKSSEQTDTDTAMQYTYTQNFYVGWVNVLGFGGGSSSSTFKTTINITDARGLLNAYNEAGVIINTEDSPYTDAYVDELEAAYNAVPKNMVQGLKYYDQATVNATTKTITDILDNPKYKADYSEYDKAVAEAESIIAAGNSEGVYEQGAFDEYVTNVGLVPVPDRTLSTDDQAIIDASTNQLKDLKEVLEQNKYADYTELDAAKDRAQAILDNPAAYSQETIDAVTQALAQANQVPANMVVGENNINQETIDAAAGALNSVVDSAVPLDGDYTEYNNAKSEIDAILNAGNADENGNPIYKEDVFTNAANYVTRIDTNLDKNLKVDNQSTIDDATAALERAKTYLEQNKYADYTDFDAAKSEIENIVSNPDNYSDAIVDAANKVLEEANQVPADMVVGKDNVNQNTIDAVTDAMQEVIDSSKAKADYTDYNNAKAEADSLVNDDGNGNPIYDEDAFNAYKEAVNNVDTALDKNLPESEQSKVDDATASLENLKAELENNKKADYTDFDAAKDALEEIVNAPAGTYTDETVKNAQDALEEANKVPADMVVGENNANQDIIDNATQNMQDAIDSAEKKADYTEFDKVVDALEDIVNAPEGTYTEETVKNAQDALDNIVAGTDMDLPESEQSTLDEIVSDLQDVVDSAEKKADYTDYNNAKAEADSLVNDDGNGKPLYDEDAFNAYKEAVNNVDTALDKNLPESEQSKVDDAAASLENLKAELEDKRIYTITFTDKNGEVISSVDYVNGATFGSISSPALPEDTDTTAYVGWLNNGEFVTDDTKLSGDFTLTVAEELKKIIPGTDSTVVVGDKYITGIDNNTTVEELISQLQNDELVLEVRHYTGSELESEALVGTGSTITLKSKYTGVIYETRMIIIYGDVDGDGDVDEEDIAKSTDVTMEDASYDEEHGYFFIANDVCADGYIDALDCWMIGLIKNGHTTVLSV